MEGSQANVLKAFYGKYRVGLPYREYLTERGEWKGEPQIHKVLSIVQTECVKDLKQIEELKAKLWSIYYP